MCQSTRSVGCVLLGWFLLAAPGRAGEPCLRDAPPHDGHPIFGHPHFRCTLVAEPTDDFAATCFTVADLDGDGDLDVAITNQEFYSGNGPAHLTVLLNKGDGIFEDPVPYELGLHPTAVVSGDVDGDLDADLVVTSATTGTIAVLMNDGDGTFAPRVEYPVGASPRSLAMADLDGDVDLDLVVMNQGSNNISVLGNNGDGTFAAHVTYPAGTVSGPPSDGWRYGGPFLAVGDLDGDADVDVIVPAVDGISVLMNNGDGTFAPLTRYALTHPKAWSIAVGDWDRDQDLDLAVVTRSNNPYTRDLAVFMNNGNGTFAAPVYYDIDTQPAPTTVHRAAVVAAEDLDGDGDLDLAIAYHSPNKIGLMYNNGDGTFAPVVRYDMDPDQRYIGVADLSGDGHPDLAVLAKAGRYKLACLFNKGDGTFHTPFSYPEFFQALGPHPEWNTLDKLAAADLDRDADLDLVISVRKGDRATGNVFVMLNDGAGNFSESGPYRFGENLNYIGIGDLNGDLFPDLVVADYGTNFLTDNGGVWIIFNNGDATFGPAEFYATPGAAHGLALAMVDSDTWPDIVVGNGTVSGQSVFLFTNRGDSTFTGPVPIDVGALQPLGVALADFQDLNRADLIATSTGDDVITMSFNDGNGLFKPASIYPCIPAGPGTLGPWAAAPLDFDDDLDLDVVVINRCEFRDQNVFLFDNQEAGRLGPRLDAKARQDDFLEGLGAADLDSDSREDLALAGTLGVTVVLGLSNEGLARQAMYGTAQGSLGMAFGDFDRDGDLDLATANDLNYNFSILWNLACDRPNGDFDGDGDVDLADFVTFQLCFGGSNNPPAATCPPGVDADLDGDGDVDLADFLIFQQNFTGSL